MIQMGASPRPEIVPRPSYLRAFPAGALGAVADQMETGDLPVLIPRGDPDGLQLDAMGHK